MAAGGFYVPVSYITDEARNILDHLNARRLIASDGPGNLPRDVRGLANLFDFTTQESENLTVQSALENWIRRNEPSATVQQLLRYLEIIDRYDVRDDLLELAAANRLVNEPPIPDNVEAYTTDDLEQGSPQFYDALVLYAEENYIFVERMFNVMQEIGFKLFKKHGLAPGYMKQEAMTELIATRCRYTILVFSPAFLKSLEQKFYSQFVHAEHLAGGKRPMIPVIYQKCQLFKEFQYYTNLKVVDSDFWRSLAIKLNCNRQPSRLDIPSWLASVAVEPSNILPTLPTVRLNEYNPPIAVNETRYRSEDNRQANNLNQRTNAFVTSEQAVNGTQDRIEKPIEILTAVTPTNTPTRSSLITSTKPRAELKAIDELSTVTLVQSTHQCAHHNWPKGTNETPYRTETKRSIVTGHFSQHNDVFVAKRTPDRPVADQISDESSSQFTNAPNGPIVNRHVADTVASTNSPGAETDVRSQPAYDYVVSVQIVADHFGEHPNITDPEPTQSSPSSSSNIPNDQTVNSQSSLLNTPSSATQSNSLSSNILNNRTVNSQSSLLTTSSSARSSAIDHFASWCRDRRLWVARNRLFQNRIRRAN